MKIKMKKINGGSAPIYKTEGASGADLRACLEHPITIKVNGIQKVPTGLILEIPKGYEGQVRTRSGLALKHGIVVVNSPGTIDCDYRGEVGVLLHNTGTKAFTIKNRDRIAQLVIVPVEHGVEFVNSDVVTETERGDGGFGHTGVSDGE